MTTRTDTLKVKLEADDDGKVHASLSRAATDSDKVSEATGKTSKGLEDLADAGSKTEQALGAGSRAAQTLGDTLGKVATGGINSAQEGLGVLVRQSGALAEALGGGLAAGLATGGIAAVVLALAAASYGFIKGEEESDKFTKALYATGQQSAVTTGQMEDLVDVVGASTGSYGKAAQALTLMANTGQYTKEQYAGLSTAVVNFAMLTGGDLSDSLRILDSLTGQVNDGLVKLDSQYHFLTQTVYDQIAALKLEGDTDAARALEQKAWAEATNQRADDVRQHLGYLASAWDYVKEHASDAWHAMMSLGTTESVQSKVQSQLDYINAALTKRLADDKYYKQDPDTDQQVVYLRRKQSDLKLLLQAQELWQKNIEDSDKRMQAHEKALDSFLMVQSPGVAGFIDKANEINKRRLMALSGVVDQKTIDHINAVADQQIRDAVKRANATDGLAAPHPHGRKFNAGNYYQKAVDDFTAEITAAGRLADMQTRANAQVQTFTDNLDQQLAIQQQKYDLEVLGLGMGAKEYQQAQQLLQIRQQEAQALARLNNQYQQQQQQIENSFAGKNDPSDLANKADALAQLQATFDAERAATQRYYADDLALAKQHYTALDAARADWRNGLISGMQDWIDQGADVAGQTRDMFTDAFGQMNDALTNFVTTGKLNFGDFAKSVIADLARMELRVIESQILRSILGAFLGGVSDNGSASYADYSGGGDVALGTGVVSGVRAGGGPVAGGALYEVAEGGKPEVLSAGGRTYLLMGPDGGYVSPAQRGDTQPAITGQGMQASGSGDSSPQVVVNITNKGQPMQAEQTNARSQGGKVFIDIVVGEVDKRISRGGSTGQAIQQAFGLQRRGVPVGG